MSKTTNAPKGEQFISQESDFQTLSAGSYVGTVSKISDDVSEAHGLPQKVIELKDIETGATIRHWFNRKGILVDANGDLVLDKNGNIQEDEEKTAACNNIIGQFANKAGIPKGESFGWADLMNQEVGFVVENHTYNGKATVRVKGFYAAEMMRERLEAASADYSEA